jgi:hypothetical protein
MLQMKGDKHSHHVNIGSFEYSHIVASRPAW